MKKGSTEGKRKEESKKGRKGRGKDRRKEEKNEGGMEEKYCGEYNKI